MINKVDGGVNFTAHVIRNELFKEGVKQAKKDAGEDYKYGANEFANAVKYLESDGTQDIYEVSKEKTRNNLLLYKNGDYIKQITPEKVGSGVMALFTDYVKFDLGVPVAKPFTSSMEKKVKLAELSNVLDGIQKNLDAAKEILGQQREDIDTQVTKEVRKKLSTLG